MASNQLTAGVNLLKAARQFTGIPYVYGLHDCSWLTETAALDVGIVLPRTTEAQYKEYPLQADALNRPGDLWFIEGDPIDANPGHVMIWFKEGWVFEAEQTGTLIGPKPFTGKPEFRTRPALAHPLPSTIKHFGVVVVDAAQAEVGVRHGWERRYWDGESFATTPPNPLRTTYVYMVKDFRKKR